MGNCKYQLMLGDGHVIFILERDNRIFFLKFMQPIHVLYDSDNSHYIRILLFQFLLRLCYIILYKNTLIITLIIILSLLLQL